MTWFSTDSGPTCSNSHIDMASQSFLGPAIFTTEDERRTMPDDWAWEDSVNQPLAAEPTSFFREALGDSTGWVHGFNYVDNETSSHKLNQIPFDGDGCNHSQGESSNSSLETVTQAGRESSSAQSEAREHPARPLSYDRNEDATASEPQRALPLRDFQRASVEKMPTATKHAELSEESRSTSTMVGNYKLLSLNKTWCGVQN
jgi:hypothetical protein